MKRSAVKWNPWLADLSIETIKDHWAQNPDDEVGVIVGDDFIVFDVDTRNAADALKRIEMQFGLPPRLLVKTARGEHHFFRRANGTYARSDSHSTAQHPERIDVRTGRALVILPPSSGKEVHQFATQHARELEEIAQDAIDAVFLHNGRTPPRPSVAEPSQSCVQSEGDTLAQLRAALAHFDPDCSYADWVRILMVVHHETCGSAEGFALVDAWSAKCTKKYPGSVEVRKKWRSFDASRANPVTMGTLVRMLGERGIEWEEVCASVMPGFERQEYVTSPPGADSNDVREKDRNPLERYTLSGMADEIAQQAAEQVPLLGQLALKGQATIFYAAPNTGKTLITLTLLSEGIREGRIDPRNTYYINVDDTSSGLVEKLRIADEYGFHMLAEGHRDFTAGRFLSIVKEFIRDDRARGVVIILDTAKKFVDLMDKGKTSYFTGIIRQFVVKGGTVIALAHTNKHRGRDGKPVYGGTSDVVDDFDCAYTVAPTSPQAEPGKKIVEFENIKRRGDVLDRAVYRYSLERGISYTELLLSVEPVDETQLVLLRQAAQIESEAEVKAAIAACIRRGDDTKMKLVQAAAEEAGVSKRTVIRIIDKYTGDDPAVHLWRFVVRDRGAKQFVLLDRALPAAGSQDTAR